MPGVSFVYHTAQILLHPQGPTANFLSFYLSSLLLLPEQFASILNPRELFPQALSGPRLRG